MCVWGSVGRSGWVGAVIQDQEPREALVLMGRPPRNWSRKPRRLHHLKLKYQSKRGDRGLGGSTKGPVAWRNAVCQSPPRSHAPRPRAHFKQRNQLAGAESRSFSHSETKRRRIDCESLCGPTPREIRAHKALWDKHTTPHDPIPIRTLSTTIAFCVFGMPNIKISPTFFSSCQFATLRRTHSRKMSLS